MSISEDAGTSHQRAAWMRLLSLAQTDELTAGMTQLAAMFALPRFTWLRPPETGMTMVQGRSGGTGTRFNLGEMTVTRCALTVQTDVSEVGIAYVQGRSARHVEHAALADALLQNPLWHDRVSEAVLAPLRDAYQARITQRAAALAETRVDFFTMERGENPND